MGLWGLAAAGLASAGIGAIGSKASADAGVEAAEKAADAQLQGVQETNALNRDIYNTNLQLYQPQWETGIANNAALSFALGTSARPDTLSFTYPNALSDGGGYNIEYVPGSTTTSGGVSRGGSNAGTNSNLPPTLIGLEGGFGAFGDSFGATVNNRSGSSYGTGGGGSTRSTDGFYRVSDQQFGTREEAQAYVDKMQADNSFTPTYDGYDQNYVDYFGGLNKEWRQGVEDLYNIDNFTASPDYQFRKDEGIDAMRGAAAAGGLRLAGSTLKGIGDYSSNLAAGEWNNYLARGMGILDSNYNREGGQYLNWMNMLSGQAAQLPTATTNIANAGNTYATNAGNATMAGANATAQGYQSAGAAKASGYEGMAQAGINGIGNLTQMYMMNQLTDGALWGAA